MNSVESLRVITPQLRSGDNAHSHAHTMTIEQRFSPSFADRQTSEADPISSREPMHLEFIRIGENPKNGTSEASFAFELAGVVWNGRSRDNARWREGATQTHGDHLLSRLLPLLGDNAEIRFIYEGGADTSLRWSIDGTVWGARSREDAIARAENMRRSLQMILASERCFRFLPKRQDAMDTGTRWPMTWRTDIRPLCTHLRISPQGALGFSEQEGQPRQSAAGIRISPPVPGVKSFRSLAEAVLLNPYPITLVVGLSRYALDGRARSQLMDIIEWMRRHPVEARDQLSSSDDVPMLDEMVQRLLQEWILNPVGARLRCALWSADQPADSLAEVIGRDVFGTSVVPMSAPCDPSSVDADTPGSANVDRDVNLGACLRSGDMWPMLFPGIESLAAARIRRLFNHEAPALDEHGVLLGHIVEDSLRDVRMSDAGRQQHCYVTGATGAGKSTLLFNMILQDIRAGRGVGVIDPHGDLYDQLLEAIPLDREQDVVLFNPGGSDSSPGINLLEHGKDHESFQVNFVVNELLKTFERLYDMRVCGGPMFESYFRNAVLLLLESGLDEVTLTELSLVFEDSEYRRFLKGRCRNPLVVGFWNGQAEKARGEASLDNIGPYITSKVNSFTCNAVLRAVIGQAKSTIDMSSIIDGRKILLMRLSKGILGEMDTQLLGSVVVSKLFLAALSRARVKASEREPFYLYVDEFQNFANDTVANMMSEARKYRLYLTLANQTLSQLRANHGQQDVLDSVLGNVGNLIAFRVGPQDAEKLRTYTEPEFSGLDIQGLPNFHAVGRMVTAHGPTRPFVFRTAAATVGPDDKCARADIWDRREKMFSTPIADIEAQIRQRRTVHKVSKKSEGESPTVAVPEAPASTKESQQASEAAT